MTVTGASRYLGRCLVLLSLLMLSGQGQAARTVAESIGEAFDLETDELLYSETHCVSDDALEREVIYRDTEQQLIAHKTLSYRKNLLAPSFLQRNFYSSELIAVESGPDRITMSVTKLGESGPGDIAVVKPDLNLPIVIDAGFDVYVRRNWDRLQATESQVFQFPFAAREMLVELRISATSCSYYTETDTCFSLQIDNWLLRLLTDPIELGYDTNLRRLSRYRGLSNIGDGEGEGEGEGLEVDIRYQYVDVPATACVVSELNLPDGEVFPNLIQRSGRVNL